MDEKAQRAIRELRRSGASWPVQTLVAEFDDDGELLGLANIALRKHKEILDQKNLCTKCNHSKH